MISRGIWVGIAAMAFVAGTLTTGTIASAAPNNTPDNLGMRIKALEDIIQIDPTTGDVMIKSESNLSLEAGDNKKISVNTETSFEDNTTMKKNTKVSGKTELEDGATVMGEATMQTLETSEDAAIGGMVTLNAGTDDASSLYTVVETFTNGGLGGFNKVYCNEPSDLPVVGSVTRDGRSEWHRTQVYIEDGALVSEVPAFPEKPVTAVLLCATIG